MSSHYLTRLEALDEAGFLIPPARHRLLLLTGQSCFASSQLRPEQRSFLQQIAPTATNIVPSGFPWHKDTDCEAVPPGLLLASGRNALQCWWASRRGRFTNVLAQVLRLVQARTEGCLAIVTGSCGIHLLAAALDNTPVVGPPIRVFALGPVGRVPPRARLQELVVAQGTSDYWSRALWAGPVHHRPACGHMDYYSSKESRALARDFFAEVVRA